MSTNSRIGIATKVENGYEYESIYCHWDGYFSHNGEILRNHWNNETDIKSLIANGDISSLDETLENTLQQSYTHRGEDFENIKPQKKVYESYDDIIKEFKKGFIEFVYIWETENQKWVGIDVYNANYTDLTKEKDTDSENDQDSLAIIETYNEYKDVYGAIEEIEDGIKNVSVKAEIVFGNGACVGLYESYFQEPNAKFIDFLEYDACHLLEYPFDIGDVSPKFLNTEVEFEDLHPIVRDMLINDFEEAFGEVLLELSTLKNNTICNLKLNNK